MPDVINTMKMMHVLLKFERVFHWKIFSTSNILFINLTIIFSSRHLMWLEISTEREKENGKTKVLERIYVTNNTTTNRNHFTQASNSDYTTFIVLAKMKKKELWTGLNSITLWCYASINNRSIHVDAFFTYISNKLHWSAHSKYF